MQETSNKAGKAPERPLTPKSIRIMSLEDDNRRWAAHPPYPFPSRCPSLQRPSWPGTCRLLEENASLKDEQAAILSRAVQRDKIDHHRHMGNVAFQEQHYE